MASLIVMLHLHAPGSPRLQPSLTDRRKPDAVLCTRRTFRAALHRRRSQGPHPTDVNRCDNVELIHAPGSPPLASLRGESPGAPAVRGLILLLPIRAATRRHSRTRRIP